MGICSCTSMITWLGWHSIGPPSTAESLSSSVASLAASSLLASRWCLACSWRSASVSSNQVVRVSRPARESTSTGWGTGKLSCRSSLLTSSLLPSLDLTARTLSRASLYRRPIWLARSFSSLTLDSCSVKNLFSMRIWSMSNSPVVSNASTLLNW